MPHESLLGLGLALAFMSLVLWLVRARRTAAALLSLGGIAGAAFGACNWRDELGPLFTVGGVALGFSGLFLYVHASVQLAREQLEDVIEEACARLAERFANTDDRADEQTSHQDSSDEEGG